MAHLHVVNGSGTAKGFRQAHLEGEVAVWNEALVLGPVSSPLGSTQFWEQRAQYFDGFRDPDDTQPSYEQLMGPELAKLKLKGKYQSITLWFEHDYFCQVNMMAVLSWVSMLHPDAHFTLVCINQYPGIENFRGLGQLNPEDFKTLWPQRKSLSPADLAYAQLAWNWYSGPSPLFSIATPCPAVFEYWPHAMSLHQKRFPESNGLNSLQNWVLTVVAQNDFEFGALMRHLLLNQSEWGFGDLQYQEILNHLDACLDIQGPYKLSTTGEQVLSGQLVFDYPNHHVGGARYQDFYWKQGRLQASEA